MGNGNDVQKMGLHRMRFIYDEELGDPEHGLAAGTAWEDVPEDWECPECNAAKSDFEMEQVG